MRKKKAELRVPKAQKFPDYRLSCVSYRIYKSSRRLFNDETIQKSTEAFGDHRTELTE